MTDPMPVVEIMRRADQGVTRPFLCRGADGQAYFVKGRSAGRRSLICEWVGGRLARSLGLPVPEFRIMEAPSALLALHPEGADLGPGPVFGSRCIPNVQELSRAHLHEVPRQVRRDVLMLDWWIQNQDRTLTELGGNPNLLWDTEARAVAVIDHNVAFDQGFSAAQFAQTHVFADEMLLIFQDLAERGTYAQRLGDALAGFAPACDTIPPEWWFQDGEGTVPVDWDRTSVYDTLARFTQEDFWTLPT